MFHGLLPHIRDLNYEYTRTLVTLPLKDDFNQKCHHLLILMLLQGFYPQKRRNLLQHGA